MESRRLDEKKRKKGSKKKRSPKKGGPGLWANMHAKRARGERPARPGEKGYPKKAAWDALKSEGLLRSVLRESLEALEALIQVDPLASRIGINDAGVPSELQWEDLDPEHRQWLMELADEFDGSNDEEEPVDETSGGGDRPLHLMGPPR